jgi:hypothetical protein
MAFGLCKGINTLTKKCLCSALRGNANPVSTVGTRERERERDVGWGGGWSGVFKRGRGHEWVTSAKQQQQQKKQGKRIEHGWDRIERNKYTAVGISNTGARVCGASFHIGITTSLLRYTNMI